MSAANKEMVKKETGSTVWRRTCTPEVDIVEREHEILLIADMPGVDENSLDVTIEKNVLRIYGRAGDSSFEGYRLVGPEYGSGDYERVFSISDEIDREGIHASLKQGVLRLVLPKAQAAKTRKIPVIAES